MKFAPASVAIACASIFLPEPLLPQSSTARTALQWSLIACSPSGQMQLSVSTCRSWHTDGSGQRARSGSCCPGSAGCSGVPRSAAASASFSAALPKKRKEPTYEETRTCGREEERREGGLSGSAPGPAAGLRLRRCSAAPLLCSPLGAS